MTLLYRMDTYDIDSDEVTIDDRGVAHLDVIVMREGVLTYERTDGRRDELIHREEMRKYLPSLKGGPITNGHPVSFIGPDDVEDKASGIGSMNPEMGILRETDEDGQVVDDEGDGIAVIKQHHMIFDQDLIDAIMQGKKEVSSGRLLEFDESPGTFRGESYDGIQRNLVHNHTAYVDNGRCGEFCSVIQDQRELPDEVEECVRSMKEEGTPKSEAIPICQEQMDAAQDEPNDWARVIGAGMEARADRLDKNREALVVELAERVGVEVVQAQRWIDGRERPPHEVIGDIAAVSEIEQDELEKLDVERWGPREGERPEPELDTGFCASNTQSEEEIEITTNEETGKVKIVLDGQEFDFSEILDGEDCDDCGLEEAVDSIDETALDQLSGDNLNHLMNFLADVMDVPVAEVRQQMDPLVEQSLTEEGQDSAPVGRLQEVEDELEDKQERIDELTEEKAKLDVRIDNLEKEVDQMGEGEDQTDQPEAGGNEGVGGNFDKLRKLVNAIEQENPEYNAEGKSEKQIMMDAIRELTDIDLDGDGEGEAEDSGPDESYLEAATDMIVEELYSEDSASGEVVPGEDSDDTEETEDEEPNVDEDKRAALVNPNDYFDRG